MTRCLARARSRLCKHPCAAPRVLFSARLSCSFLRSYKAFDEEDGIEVAWNQVKLRNVEARERDALMQGAFAACFLPARCPAFPRISLLPACAF